MFGQGVVKKLTNIGGFNWKEWDKLEIDEKRVKNAIGDELDIGVKASSWSKLHNLANPKSSFSMALKVSDAVWCTDWDKKGAKIKVAEVVQIGYKAPLYNSNNLFFKEGINDFSKNEYDSQLLTKEFISEFGEYEFAGCINRF